MRAQWFLGAVSICWMGFVSIANAEVKLPKILSNSMVLQRDRAVPVWGWDNPGTEVTVSIGEASAKGKADATGKWTVQLPAMKAGGPHIVKVEGSSKVEFSDVLFGEVWLCSGQSNMEWTVNSSLNPKEETAAAKYPTIRHIKIPLVPADKPQTDVKSGSWQVCSPTTAGNFTAVGYFFAVNLQKELNVPVGLIGSNWGGTRIEPWTNPEGFNSVPALSDISSKLATFPTKNAQGVVANQSPLALYNGMIAPLVPYAIRGALWYQGESNNGEGMLYFEKKKALINGWRKVWNDEVMPFYFVQLAPYDYNRAMVDGKPATSGLPGIWEAQTATLKIPYTGMAVTTDISNLKDIHPKNKQDVGKRLALWALANTYGKSDLVYSGPLYKSMKVSGDKIELEFNHVGGGLVSRDGKPLSFFAIAGEDKKFVDAKAVVVGKSIIVSAEGVTKPVSVRFGWHEEAEPNLSNKEGLPASPFRTDDWK